MSRPDSMAAIIWDIRADCKSNLCGVRGGLCWTCQWAARLEAQVSAGGVDGWVSVAGRVPTEADADAMGDVVWLRGGAECLGRVARGVPVDATHWKPSGRLAAIPKVEDPDPDGLEHDFSNIVRGAVLKKTSAPVEAPSVAMQYLDKLVAERMAPIYEAFAEALKVSAPVVSTSVAMQYLDKVVAERMAPFYEAFAATPKASDPVDGETRKNFIQALNAELGERGLGGVDPADPTHPKGDAS